MMGWRPEHVRASTVMDFENSLEGWIRSQGGEPSTEVSDEAIAELDDLMERYPDAR